MIPQPWTRPEVIAHSLLLAESFRHWTGRDLSEAPTDPADLSSRLYHIPFVLVSHGTEADPLFSYANLAAQSLWELDWDALIGMPSRRTAEPEAQGERSQALKTALAGGWVKGYSGIRISSTGRRFIIKDGIIWSLRDAYGEVRGQAACFSLWNYI